MIHLALQIGVQQRAVTFATAPENVARTVQLSRGFDGFLDLRGGIGKSVRVATRGGAMYEARMHKQARCAPK